jgi:hypothetical protein
MSDNIVDLKEIQKARSDADTSAVYLTVREVIQRLKNEGETNGRFEERLNILLAALGHLSAELLADHITDETRPDAVEYEIEALRANVKYYEDLKMKNRRVLK